MPDPRRVLAWFVLLAACAAASEQSLDGPWTIRLDPDDAGRTAGWHAPDHAVWSLPAADQRADEVPVPSALEETLGPYDGVAWYRRAFTAPRETPDATRWFLAFDNANDLVDVWWNGDHVGRHAGSDVPFRLDVHERVVAAPGEAVTITVRCVDPGSRPIDGLLMMARPHAKESWYYNYGGLVGSVALRAVPELEVTSLDVWLDDDGTPQVDVFVADHRATPGDVLVEARLGDATASVDARASSDPTSPSATLALPAAADLPRWSPDTPHRHELSITLNGDDTLSRTTTHLVGLRRFEVDGTRFVLNGEVVRPVGVLYQPLHPRGLCNPPDDAWIRREMEAIKAAGFDLVRAHIRVMPEVYEVCDEIGLLVHAEPTLGWVRRERADTWPAVERALVSGAETFRGHPSIVMVGMLNELSGLLYKRIDTLHARFAALLPRHLVLDDSGSWLGEAHYRNPGAADAVSFDDEHLYRAWPWASKDIDDARQLGTEEGDDSARRSTGRLVYVSEYGFGGMPDLVGSALGFEGEDWRHDGGDAIGIARDAAEDLATTPVAQLLPTLEQVSEAGGRNQARAAEVMTRALLGNERVAALVYTQWRDVAWECGAGLVSTWGDPKPALAAFTEMLADREAAARPTPPPELAPRATHPVARVRWLDVDDDLRAHLAPHTAPHDAPRDDLPELAIVGPRVAPWGPERIAETLALWRWVADGGTAWMVAPAGYPWPELLFGYDGLGQVAELPFEARMSGARGHFIGTHHVVSPSGGLLAGLPWTAPLLDERLAPIAPHRVLAVRGVPRVTAESVTLDGYGRYLGAPYQRVPFGEGALVLSTLRTDDAALAHDASARVLENALRTAADVAHDVAQRKRPGAWDDAIAVAPADAKALGRAVWRHKVFFSLAERLAYQRFDGQRAEHHDLDDLPAIVARKNAGLRLAIAGDVPAAIATLDGIDDELTLERELFLRRESELARALHRPEGDVSPMVLADTVAVAHHHAIALRLLRAGAAEAAMDALDDGFEALAAARAGD